MALSDYAKGLPGLYAQRRAEQRSKIDQFIMEFEEDKRRADRNAAIQAMQAQANIALAFGELGLNAKELEAQLNQPGPPGMPTDLPPGLVAVPNDKGGWYVREDPSYQTPGGGSSGGGGSGGRAPSPSRGEYPPNKLRKEGFVGGWQVKPKNIKGPFVRATDGTWWKKPGGSGGGGGDSGSGRMNTTRLQAELIKLYKPGEDDGWEARYFNNPIGAGREIARWVREMKRHFIVGPIDQRRVDIGKLRAVLRRVGGRPAAEAERILKGYIAGTPARWK
jgi:hypothetical protein